MCHVRSLRITSGTLKPLQCATLFKRNPKEFLSRFIILHKGKTVRGLYYAELLGLIEEKRVHLTKNNCSSSMTYLRRRYGNFGRIRLQMLPQKITR